MNDTVVYYIVYMGKLQYFSIDEAEVERYKNKFSFGRFETASLSTLLDSYINKDVV